MSSHSVRLLCVFALLCSEPIKDIKRPRIHHPYPLHRQLTEFRNDEYSILTRFEMDEAEQLMMLVDKKGDRIQYKYRQFERFTNFLCTLTDHMRYQRLQAEYQWSVGSIRLDEHFWVDQIINTLNSENSLDAIRWWSNEEFSSFYPSEATAAVPHDGFERCIGSVDGTYIKIQRPASGKGESWYYSNYVKTHAILFIAVIDRFGRIRYVDEGTPPGNWSEKACYARCALRHQLPHHLKLLGDGAYNEMSTCWAPYSISKLKATPSGDAKESMKVYNKRLRRYRVLIEWTFGTLKRNWALLGGEWTRDKEDLPRMFLCCCLLYNYLKRIRKLDGAFENVEEEMLDIDYPPREEEGILI